MRNTLGILSMVMLLAMGCSEKKTSVLDLSGEWSYRLDSAEAGLEERWFADDFTNKIQLPGALRDYKIGDEPGLTTDWTGSIYDSSWYFNPAMEKYRQPGNVKFPFWLTPVKHYKGMAWYQREIEIPTQWEGKEIQITLERPHWQTKVWVDTVCLGSANSLSVPHRFRFNANKVGTGKHKLTVLVDNEIRDVDPGINSHSISDHTQGNWNGIVGDITMEPRTDVSIQQLKITPNLSKGFIRVDIKFSKQIPPGNITFSINGVNHHHYKPSSTTKYFEPSDSLSYTVGMTDSYRKWSEFSPNLYELKVELSNDAGVFVSHTSQFGMREFTVKEKHFEINGIPTFLRGTTECSVFPLTGYPPTDKEEWARIFKICKDFGLNHMRFHSYCPPEAAFYAADEAGIYLHVEGPSWAKYSTSLGNGKPLDQYLMDETKRIIDEYGNHPSFVMMAYGNEPSGNYVPYLENWVEHFRNYDPQRVFTGAATGRSWAIIENSDFIDRSPPRGLAWKNTQPNSVFDYRDKTEGQERPYVTFEMGQWCVFPNFKEIDKYTGPLKAKNFELFQEDLADHHMADLADDFLTASGKLQVSSYKQEIEATLRTPNLAGFQLLSLNDFSGQGTALVGVLDAFWDEKGYVTASEFKSFCNKVVPLTRLPKYTFENNETLKAGVEIANFSGLIIKNTPVKWRLLNDSATIVKEGKFEETSIAVGPCNEIGTLEVPLDFVKQASEYTLSVSVGEYENQWKIWVYPANFKSVTKPDVSVVNELSPEVEKALQKGEKVLLLVAGKVENGKDVIQHFTPAFWNTSWFRMRPPHTTGILVRDQHPVFNDFPTEAHSDLQWWEICNLQQVMNLENFPTYFRPLIQPIDTWFLNRRLAMLFEAKVGNGKLMVCSADLTSDLNERPVARQLKHSILNYMSSDTFSPNSEVDYQIINELFEKKKREGWKSYVNEAP